MAYARKETVTFGGVTYRTLTQAYDGSVYLMAMNAMPESIIARMVAKYFRWANEFGMKLCHWEAVKRGVPEGGLIPKLSFTYAFYFPHRIANRFCTKVVDL